MNEDRVIISNVNEIEEAIFNAIVRANKHIRKEKADEIKKATERFKPSESTVKLINQPNFDIKTYLSNLNIDVASVFETGKKAMIKDR